MTNLQAMETQENAKISDHHPLARCVCVYADVPLFCVVFGHWRAPCVHKQGYVFFLTKKTINFPQISVKCRYVCGSKLNKTIKIFFIIDNEGWYEKKSFICGH